MTRQRLAALRFPKDVVDDVSPAGRAAPALPRLLGRHLDRRGGPPLRPRRRPAARAAAPADPLGLHHPQRPQGAGARRGVRLAGAADRRARGAGGPGDDPAGPRRQRDHALARHRARTAGRQGLPAPAGAADGTRPAGRDDAVAELRAWAADQGLPGELTRQDSHIGPWRPASTRPDNSHMGRTGHPALAARGGGGASSRPSGPASP